jgi:hypothetical protein
METRAGKKNNKRKTEYWYSYKLHLSLDVGEVQPAAVLTSSSPHGSQIAIPLMQMTSERATVLYNLAGSADAREK